MNKKSTDSHTFDFNEVLSLKLKEFEDDFKESGNKTREAISRLQCRMEDTEDKVRDIQVDIAMLRSRTRRHIGWAVMISSGLLILGILSWAFTRGSDINPLLPFTGMVAGIGILGAAIWGSCAAFDI